MSEQSTSGTDHIVTFDETANRSVDLLPDEACMVDSADEIELHEYHVYGQKAECCCGEFFETHEEGLEHLQEARSVDTGTERGDVDGE